MRKSLVAVLTAGLLLLEVSPVWAASAVVDLTPEVAQANTLLKSIGATGSSELAFPSTSELGDVALDDIQGENVLVIALVAWCFL